MKLLTYSAMTSEQFEQLTKKLELFMEERSTQKKLYEVQYSVFELEAFLRGSDPNRLCVNRRIFDDLVDPWFARQVIERSFGNRVVEFVPRIKKIIPKIGS